MKTNDTAYAIFRIAERQECFPDLPALAARLGIPKHDGSPTGMVLMMNNGDGYDLFAIINAFLDRGDEVMAAIDRLNQITANQAGS